jgi:membrane protein
MGIGAQGLLAVLRMLVVLAAFLPHDIAVTLYRQVSDTVRLDRQQSAPLGGLMTAGEGSANAGVVGATIALVSATSFSRALQRMYARAFDLEWTGRRGELRASSVWLFGWLASLAFEAWFGAQSGDLPLATAVGVYLCLHVGFWWWTLRSLSSVTSRGPTCCPPRRSRRWPCSRWLAGPASSCPCTRSR